MAQKKFFHKKILFSGIILCLSSPAFAANDDAELQELLELNLEELTVSIASKREEKISDAPGIVNVLTAQEIRASGSRTLMEALERMPGVFGHHNAHFGEHSVGIRGDVPTSGNYHTLILLNGRPVREGVSGSLDFVTLRTTPLSIVERIEVVRGPGSVLYGTNAFSGVVNIITKRAKKVAEGEVSVSYGSFNSRGTEFYAGSAGEDYNISSSLLLRQSDGFNVSGNDITTNFGSDNRADTNANFTLNADYKGFTVNVMNSYLEQDLLQIPNAFPFSDGWFRQRMIDLGYTHEISDDWQLKLNAAHTKWDQRYISLVKLDGNDWNNEITLDGKLSKNVNLLVGGTYQRLIGDDLLTGAAWDTTRLGAYSQLDYSPTDWLKLVAGIQMNDPEGVKKDFSPRAGAIFQFNDNWGGKLLYGEAFRSAYPTEQFISLPGFIVGDPSLKPEKVSTIDAQIFYRNKGYYAALTVFESHHQDTIAISGANYVNGSDIDTRGLTLEGEARINADWKLRSSFSYQENEDALGNDDVFASPNWIAKAGFTYTGWDGISLDVFDRYTGNSEVHAVTAQVNEKPDSYHLVTANIIADVHTFIPQVREGITFSLYGFNLLDEDISGSQPPSSALVNTIQSRSGRSVYGKVTVKF